MGKAILIMDMSEKRTGDIIQSRKTCDNSEF